jgi:short-subunit dehydrogenase
VASICGFYCAPTTPIYTASKQFVPPFPLPLPANLHSSAIVGLVRSYGKYLPEEHITMNAVCPNVIRTNISTVAFYDKLEAKGLLTPIDGLIKAFESMLGDSQVSGETFEVGPNGGFVVRKGMEYLDKESQEVVKLIEERAHVLQEPVK